MQNSLTMMLAITNPMTPHTGFASPLLSVDKHRDYVGGFSDSSQPGSALTVACSVKQEVKKKKKKCVGGGKFLVDGPRSGAMSNGQ